MIKKLSKTEKYKRRHFKTAVTPLTFSLHPRRVSRVVRSDREQTLAVPTEPSGKSKLEAWPADPVSWARIRHYLSENSSGDATGQSRKTNMRVETPAPRSIVQKGRVPGRGLHGFEEVIEMSRCQRSQWVAVHRSTKAKGSDEAGQCVTNRRAGDNSAHGEVLIFSALPLRSISGSPRGSESQREPFSKKKPNDLTQ